VPVQSVLVAFLVFAANLRKIRGALARLLTPASQLIVYWGPIGDGVTLGRQHVDV
jgi:hypothetical protein